jgi:hypothetical protein
MEVSGQPHDPTALPLVKQHPMHFEYEAGWAPELVWVVLRRDKSLCISVIQMLYSEIITACFEIHTKHINTLCGQNGELLNVKLAVYKDPVRTAQ